MGKLTHWWKVSVILSTGNVLSLDYYSVQEPGSLASTQLQHLGLDSSDCRILQSQTKWLNNKLITSSQRLLKKYPHIRGLQNMLPRQNLSFNLFNSSTVRSLPSAVRMVKLRLLTPFWWSVTKDSESDCNNSPQQSSLTNKFLGRRGPQTVDFTLSL